MSHEEMVAMVAEVFPGVVDLRGRLVPSTVYAYSLSALMYFAFCKGSLDRAHNATSLRAWRTHMVEQSTLSPWTINARLAGVKSLVRASARMGALSSTLDADFHLVEVVSKNALRHRRKRTRNRLEPADVRALCRQPDASQLRGVRDRALLLTLASSGLRISEAVALRVEQIQRGEKLVVEVWGKGADCERLAPLGREALRWIDRWLELRGRFLESPWVFTHCWRRQPNVPTGTPMTRHNAYTMFKRHAAQVGLGYCCPHDLRKFVGTQVGEKYGIREAQKTLGHRTIATTELHYLLDTLSPGLTDDLF